MAIIALGSLGSTLGGQFGTFGAIAGKFIGDALGQALSNKLFGKNNEINREGRRLEDLTVQNSSYGHMIPIIYGIAVVAGNIIYSSPFKETPHTETRSAGRKGAKTTIRTTNYTYKVTLAIALCEGEIIDVQKIWADDQLLDLRKYNIRVYKGCETQMPDPSIAKLEGENKTPAYRGLSYIVFEDLELTDFGNRIPYFKFEIRTKLKESNKNRLENLVESVAMIPGGGEYVYDTVKQYKTYGEDYQYGYRTVLNAHSYSPKTNAVISLDHLQETLPNIKWIAVVVNWFTTSLDASSTNILPGVEFKDNAIITPEQWQVSTYNRNSAYLISKDSENRANYGGTVNDNSLIRYIKEIKKRGIKVMLYPMFFVDMPNKPWRGHLSTSPEQVSEFFRKKQGYNEFIMHYANLFKNKIDAFVIGSELIGLTKLQNKNHEFPAVDELTLLARQVKSSLGENTLVTYAADWSEYHHTDGGWHHLDKLWMSKDIDIIGIDAYFPITDKVENEYNVKQLMQGWQSGEGFDYYYDGDGKKQPISAEWAWKNIRYWWENKHFNPNGKSTAWRPKTKKIWFTEYGFPSVQACSNQPNVFWDGKSSDSGFPINSNGRVDFYAQRQSILATELYWQNSDMVENKFVWAWDARPFPAWPNNKNVWSDGNAWLKGHWIQGKLGNPLLTDILHNLLQRAGINKINIDNNIPYSIDGLVISQQSSARNLLQKLQNAYFFHIRTNNEFIECLAQNENIQCKVGYADLINLNKEKVLSISNTKPLELPTAINVNFIDKFKNYETASYCANRNCNFDVNIQNSINLPIVMDEIMAKRIAEMILYNSWLQREKYTFYLPMHYNFIKLCDNLILTANNKDYKITITEKTIGNNGILKFTATNSCYIKPHQNSLLPHLKEEKHIQDEDFWLEALDIPYITNEHTKAGVYVCATTLGLNWHPISVTLNNDISHVITNRACMGKISNKITAYNSFSIDYNNHLIVNMIHGELRTIDEAEFDNGGNLAVLGNEIIQFKYAEKITDGQYKISHLRRGLNNTKPEAYNKGERFIILNDALEFIELPTENIGNTLQLKSSINNVDTIDCGEFEFKANNTKPYAPCNIKLSNDILTWIRCDKLHNGFNNYVDIGNSEGELKFLVNIKNNGHEENFVTGKEELLLEKLSEDIEIKVCQLSSTGQMGFWSKY